MRQKADVKGQETDNQTDSSDYDSENDDHKNYMPTTYSQFRGFPLNPEYTAHVREHWKQTGCSLRRAEESMSAFSSMYWAARNDYLFSMSGNETSCKQQLKTAWRRQWSTMHAAEQELSRREEEIDALREREANLGAELMILLADIGHTDRVGYDVRARGQPPATRWATRWPWFLN